MQIIKKSNWHHIEMWISEHFSSSSSEHCLNIAQKTIELETKETKYETKKMKNEF